MRNLLLAIFSVLLLLTNTIAQDKKFDKHKLSERQVCKGKIVCIGCTLEAQEGGADAQCTLHAKHAQGLLMLDGTLWTFVDNAKGHRVITNEKLRGKEVEILGWKWAKAQYIEVSKYKVKEGTKWVLYDYCKICGFEPGDHKDKDLCAGCSGEGECK
jgi:hypothetical protein